MAPEFALTFLLAQASVVGTISMEGQPAAETTITFGVMGAEPITIVSDESGRFSLTGIEPGVYEVTLNRDRQRLTIAELLVEAGANNILLYWPPPMTNEERSVETRAAFAEGVADLAAGQYSRAEEIFRQALMLDGGQATLWASLALSQVGREQYEEALFSGMMAIRFAPGEAAYRNNVGSTLFRLGRFREAIPRYKEASERNSDGLGLFMSNTAAAYIALGSDSDAATAYSQATTDPNCPESTWFYHGALLARTGDPREAETALKRYLQLAPNGPFAEQARRRLRSLGAEPPAE